MEEGENTNAERQKMEGMLDFVLLRRWLFPFIRAPLGVRLNKFYNLQLILISNSFQGMDNWRVLTAAEQVADRLRAELSRGVWDGRMPGGSRLAVELGVGSDTVEAALRLLERKGLLAPQGAGRRRRIVVPEGNAARPMRVAILDNEPPALALSEEYVTELLHLLGKAGHIVFFADKCLQDLRMDVGRIARLVRKTKADAWVVRAGSREVIEWFAAQPLPAFALFGRFDTLPLASAAPDKVPAALAAMRAMIELGHRGIVLLTRRWHRLPTVGMFERALLDELAAHGIDTSPFNLPDWEETGEGFHACLKELFRVTPPTALILDEVLFLAATQQFLAKRGLRVPEDVSLLCTDADPSLEWCRPTVAHIRWDHRPVVRRVVRWAANVSHGKDDRCQTLTKAEFVAGGTIGPARDGH